METNEEIIEKNEELVNEVEDRRWCVYMHTCKISNKAYIGVTNTIKRRWRENGKGYFRKKKDGTYEQRAFVRALKKYKDWDNDWEHIIFADNLTQREAWDIEVKLIALFKTNCNRYQNPTYGYNMTDGGEGNRGVLCTEETKKKMSEAAKKRCNDEWRKNISEKMTGKKRGKEFAEKRRKIMSRPVIQLNSEGIFVAEYESARQASAETKIDESSIRKCCNRKLKTAGGFHWTNKEKWETDQSNIVNFIINQNQSIIQLSLSGDFIDEYNSVIEADKKLHINQSSIVKCCKGKRKTAGGFKWMYKEDYKNCIKK